MQKLVDFFIPHNCRKELRIAAAKNAEAFEKTLCILQDNRTKLKKAIKHDQTQ